MYFADFHTIVFDLRVLNLNKMTVNITKLLVYLVYRPSSLVFIYLRLLSVCGKTAQL